MKKIILIIMSFFAIISLAGTKIDSSILQNVKTNEIVSIDKLKGKKTYIKMWASWCPICLNTLKDVNELSGEKNLDFNVLTIVSPSYLGELNKERFKTWWEGLENEYSNMTVLLDNHAYIARKVRVRAYPTNVFINSDGEIEKVVPGALSESFIKQVMATIK
ncbi:redoxin family protein [Oceanivirga miroungae]|uniref:Redoxin n=1 Tax=Oceanivirga miroungae TaxID=1130046 RepID=A0A6I8M8Z7_9FUSO|nr:redoxin family protein [Oceanivirga miroungae]VWL84753.1 redoxin [Oceanivirga miroungae]